MRRLQLLLQVLVAALPGLAAVTALALLLLTLFSILGMALFGTFQPGMAATAAAMPSQSVDFHTFGEAMLTMFRLLTLDGFASALQQLLHCEGVEYLLDGSVPFARDCAFTPAPPLFLLTFAVCCPFVVCGLATAVAFDALRRCVDEFGVASDVGETLTRLALLNRVVAKWMVPVYRSRALAAAHAGHAASAAGTLPPRTQ